MNKPIAVIGTSGSLSASFALTTPQAFAATGHNTGNLAFQHATWQLIDEEKLLFSFNFKPQEIRETCRLIVLPAANFLYNGFDLGDLARRLEETKLPLVVLGLGAQAFHSIDEIKLQAGTERLLRVMAERCETIAVRGRYTAGVLERYKVSNFEVLGCPSNFINPDRNLGRNIAVRLRNRSEKIAFCPTFYSYNAEFEEKLYRSFQQNVTQVVCQDPISAVALARGDRDAEQQTWLSEASGFLKLLPAQERAALVSRFQTYLSVDAWMESYRAVDLVLGSRIHGVNIGWQSGRAALVVSFDLRTEELADTMGVPWVKAVDMTTGDQALTLVQERVAKATEVYDQHREKLAGRLESLFQRSGLAASAGLKGLMGQTDLSPESGLDRLGSDISTPLEASWGFLEQYNRKRIAGWVDTNGTAIPEIAVRLDGREIGLANANILRPDLGPNARGFQIAPSEDDFVRDVMQVEVVFKNTGRHLKNSPVTTSFRIGDEAKVLRGLGGYLFLKNDSNDVLRQITGERVLGERELDQWGTFFVALDKSASRDGSRVTFLVAPNKECVFSEFLPNDIILSEKRPVRQIELLLKNLNLKYIHFLYPLSILQSSKKFDAYSKGDSHWTDYGAAVTLDELWPLLWPNRVNEKPATSDRFGSEFRNADLLSKLGGVCIEAQTIAIREGKKYLLESTNDVLNTGRVQKFRSIQKNASGNLFMAHDSFGEWLIPFLAEASQTLQTRWNIDFPNSWLENSGQRTIIIERAERFLLTPSRLEV